MGDTGHSRVTVVRGGTVWTGGFSARVLPRTDLVIEDGVVVALESDYRGRIDVELDATDCIVAPGFVNAHVHPGATPRARTMAEDFALTPGAAFYHAVAPVLRLGLEEMTREEFAAVMEWDLLAMLRGGATTIVAEMIVPPERGFQDDWVSLVGRYGFRGQLGLTYPNRLGAIGFVKDGRIQSQDAGDVGDALRAGVALHDAHDGAFGGRLRTHLSPHGPDTVPDDVLRETRRLCDERGLRAHLHLCQHKAELSAIERRSGKTPVRHLHDIGFLGPHVMATHVTYVSGEDIPLLASSGTHVVHASYRKAKEGITSPFWEFLDAGVNVAIATDSFSHDMVLDLKLACLLGKVRLGRVDRPDAETALTCATAGAARALGRTDLGHLEPGARGDVTVIALDSVFAAPVFDPVRALVYYANASDIRHTLVDGNPILRNGTLPGVDVADINRRAKAACVRIWGLAQGRGMLPEGLLRPGHDFTCRC
jgi:cytosine/adenosine deaminase-related metal-dependent hydrolase